jgi:hypothetical protein
MSQRRILDAGLTTVRIAAAVQSGFLVTAARSAAVTTRRFGGAFDEHGDCCEKYCP